MEKLKINGLYFFILLLYFTSDLNMYPITSLVIVTFLWSMIFYLKKKNSTTLEVFFELMIRSIPLSFTSIFLKSESSIISWFNIFSMLFILFNLYHIKTSSIRAKYHKLLPLVVYMFFVAISLIVNLSKAEVTAFVVTFLNCILLFIFISSNFEYNTFTFKKIYIEVTVYTSLLLFAQIILYKQYGISLGRIEVYGGNRIAFGLTNFDFSFLSLYLVSSIYWVFPYIFKNNKIHSIPFLVITILLSAAFFTTARTGLVAFGASILVYLFQFVLNKKKDRFKTKDMIIFISFILLGLIILYFLTTSRGFGSSGRGPLNSQAIQDFLKKPMVGNGLSYNINGFKPHNIVIQWLAQSGIIATMSLVILISALLYRLTKESLYDTMTVITILLGSFFIPDIFISRFWICVLGIVFSKKSMVPKTNQRVIGHILSSGGISGAEKVVISIINYSNESKSIYFSPQGPIIRYLDEKNITHQNYKSITDLVKRVNLNKVDIIHAHDFKASLISAIIFPFKVNITHIHQNPIWLKTINFKSILFFITCLLSSKIVYVSEEAKSSFIFNRIFEYKTLVVNNFVDSDIVRSLSKTTLNINDSFYDLVFFGRLEEVKNPLYFLDLCEEICKIYPSLTAVIVGDGSMRNVVEQRIHELGLDNNIKLTGFLENPFPYINVSKISVMTSDWEGFGLTAVESMILGKPVVSRNVGGLKNIIDDNSGYLCNNIDEFIEAIILLLKDNTLYTNMSKGAIKRSKKFSNSNIWMSDINDIYSLDF